MKYQISLLLVFALTISWCWNAQSPSLTSVPKAKYSQRQLEEGLIHVRSARMEEVRTFVEETLAQVHTAKLPDYLPNWIAYHASLIYGYGAWDKYNTGKADENLSRIFTVMLYSDHTKEGPYVLREGKPWPRHSGSYFMQEHHPDQFLNYFSMTGGTLDSALEIDGKKYTMRDLLERSLKETRIGQELDFTVLAYCHYLRKDEQWRNKFGEELTLADFLKELLAKEEPVCLGTHRLGALARTFHREELREDPRMEKLWQELQRQVYSAVYELKRSQRSDGLFAPPGQVPGISDFDHADIYFSGHSLEWIMYLEGTFASDDWVVNAIESLAKKVSNNYELTYRNLDAIRSPASHFDFDGLCHAVSALERWKTLCQ